MPQCERAFHDFSLNFEQLQQSYNSVSFSLDFIATAFKLYFCISSGCLYAHEADLTLSTHYWSQAFEAVKILLCLQYNHPLPLIMLVRCIQYLQDSKRVQVAHQLLEYVLNLAQIYELSSHPIVSMCLSLRALSESEVYHLSQDQVPMLFEKSKIGKSRCIVYLGRKRLLMGVSVPGTGNNTSYVQGILRSEKQMLRSLKRDQGLVYQMFSLKQGVARYFGKMSHVTVSNVAVADMDIAV